MSKVKLGGGRYYRAKGPGYPNQYRTQISSVYITASEELKALYESNLANPGENGGAMQETANDHCFH